MNMSYTSNPNLPKVRAQAVKMVRSGYSTREVARHFGFSQSAVVKWCNKVHPQVYRFNTIPTESSRPHHHPSELDAAIVQRILELRHSTRRGAEFIHVIMQREGISVSLSSVKRTLARHGCSRYSKWKKWHQSSPRPAPDSPGDLVETDTIHDGPAGAQIYLYTLIDVHSRWAYAEVSERIGAARSSEFIRNAKQFAPFNLSLIQSDHGAEFSKFFIKKLSEPGMDMEHRYTRIRRPNDNAHIERFNRTLQDECISRIYRSIKRWDSALPEYLHYYNYERPHMGIDWQTPIERLEQFRG